MATEYSDERAKFVNDKGERLSDSPAIMVKFSYTADNVYIA
jgi:hypothetical protein